MESRDLRIALKAREELHYQEPVFNTKEDLDLMYEQAKKLAYIYNKRQKETKTTTYLSSGKLHATGVLHLLYQSVINEYLQQKNPTFFSQLSKQIEKHHFIKDVLTFYDKEFPSIILQKGEHKENLSEENTRGLFLHHVFIENPAMVKAVKPLIAPEGIHFPPANKAFSVLLEGYVKAEATMREEEEDLFSFLTAPSRLHPDSLIEQISYILIHWDTYIPSYLRKALLYAIDVVNEEEKPRFNGAPGPAKIPSYEHLEHEYEAFSIDEDWMPNVVMLAKSALVWLDQLSRSYGYPITTLDKIPNEELDLLQQRGFNGLWLIGIWERSESSKKIKNLCGNSEAEASAYSLKSYNISSMIGGWAAYHHLNERCKARHIRLASDMVPNHTGLDSDWALHHPEYFISSPVSPFPSYTFEGEDLSPDSQVEIKIEDHYYDQSDAAVTYRRRNKETNETSYIFHGNDGTSMPWNDTAQLDFLNPNTREAVIQQILHVARNFHIIRFDAAMTLAKKHVQRLWYPRLGTGGDIPGRAGYGMSDEEFNQKIPIEFWREVVDRVAQEVPNTLLLAEAFWMMEGFFVRTLGMHRVYNSAFMNMLKNQANKEYRDTIKNTISFDPEVLKRFVNFMNNPDEDTAVAQFGDGDKYFGVATLLSTMPGLPMFGHGQIEGFHEKYGMEYSRAYWNEYPNEHLINEHYRRIFPLLRLRYLFSGVVNFEIFDVIRNNSVSESIFAYVNGIDNSRALVLYNNCYEESQGNIFNSAPKLQRKENGEREVKTTTLAHALGLTCNDNSYMIYEQFPEGLTYISQSNVLFEEGLWVSLQGYETKIFLHVREVLDKDGSYEALCKKLDGRGTYSFERDLLWVKMAPLHKSLENFASPDMIDFVRQVVSEHNTTSKDIRKYVLLAGEAYARFSTVYELLLPSTKESLEKAVKEVQPKDMLQLIQNFTSCFIHDSQQSFFTIGGSLIQELPMLVNASFLLNIFINPDNTIEKALTISDNLVLEKIFSTLASTIKVESEYRLRQILQGAALLTIIPPCINEELQKEAPNYKECLSSLLHDEGFREYIGYNVHKNIIYYRKESLQEAIYLLTLSVSMKLGSLACERMTTMARAWLLSDSLAEYRIEALLEGVN
jgi:glycosidase